MPAPRVRDRGVRRRLIHRKSLLALRGVGPEFEAERMRFHGRRVTKKGPGNQTGAFSGCGARREPKEAAAGELRAAEQAVREVRSGTAGGSGGRERMTGPVS
jgi:hypothetical protein